MATAVMAKRSYGRKPLAALGKVTIAALLGTALLAAYVVLVIFGGKDPMGLIVIGLSLAGAALIVTGWRWTLLVGALVGGALAALVGPFFLFLVTTPGELLFGPILVVMALAVVAIVAGIGATVQNYRHRLVKRRTPRGVFAMLAALVGILLGAIWISRVPQAGTAAGVSPEVLTGLPALSAKEFKFDQTEIKAKVGETVALRLENGDPESHFFVIDELKVNAPIPPGQTSLTLFKPTQPGTYTFYCTPHYDKATGAGMHGALIVEP